MPSPGGKRDDAGPNAPFAIDTSRPKRTPAASAPANAFQPSNRTGSAADFERYPNLTLYLKIATTVTRILAILAAGVWSLGGLGTCVQSLVFSSDPALLKITTTLIALFMLAFGLLMIYLYYVAFMAIIELVKVVMDIERNTRRT